MNTEARTGTSNERFIADAQYEGDTELADFLRDVQRRNREIAEQAKRLLQPRLDAA
jgi:hypothetical protein